MSDATTTRPCTTCRAQIEQIRGPRGKFIPVQRVRTVYGMGPEEPGIEPRLVVVIGPQQADDIAPLYVSHFETCPDAGQHSRPRG